MGASMTATAPLAVAARLSRLPADADREIEMIVVVPESRLDMLAADVAASIRRCEAQYHGGNYYVSVPAGEYSRWAQQPGKEPAP